MYKSKEDFKTELISELKKLYSGTEFEKKGDVNSRIHDVLQLHDTFIVNSMQTQTPLVIAKKIFEYEKDIIGNSLMKLKRELNTPTKTTQKFFNIDDLRAAFDAGKVQVWKGIERTSKVPKFDNFEDWFADYIKKKK
jgi:hypothetical protein